MGMKQITYQAARNDIPSAGTSVVVRHYDYRKAVAHKTPYDT